MSCTGNKSFGKRLSPFITQSRFVTVIRPNSLANVENVENALLTVLGSEICANFPDEKRHSTSKQKKTSLKTSDENFVQLFCRQPRLEDVESR